MGCSLLEAQCVDAADAIKAEVACSEVIYVRPQSSSTNMAARRFSCCAPPFETVFPHLYALLTVSLVLGLSSRHTCSQDIGSRTAVRASDTLTGSFARHKLVPYLLTQKVPASAHSIFLVLTGKHA